ncbi:FecR family protein [Sphingobacterium chuzhouense]|uniref:FecR domain-containing protein n=1 Tax=Sphingobacterium chuzhouense TaxID=1742264 RepID=A0ABR7XME0_9SPHI|nr:FecR family protein [Sphingobacterium chuzhouense]MBD1420344.1 FecR domain-containing protein [Sphingobacterium chuzhouense]
MNNQSDINDLFEKYLSGNYSESDLETLLTYFDLPEEETSSLTQMIEKELDRSLLDEEYKRVQEFADEIGEKLFKKIDRPILPLYSPLKIAVALLLFVMAGSAVYLFNSKWQTDRNRLESRYGDDVLPGGNRAIITLDDGESVVLDESKSGIVVSDQIVYSDGTPLTQNKSHYATLTTPKGGQYQIQLPDGTNVWLNAASSLKYPTMFIGDIREVQLSGEAYFEIKHDSEKPFIVLSQGQKVRVTGTEFNISNYAGQSGEITTLISGSVEIENNSTLEKKILKPGQQSIVETEKTSIGQVDNPGEFIAWKDGYIILTEASLKEIIPHLERWYDVIFEVKSWPSVTAYVALNRDTKLSEVLDALEMNFNVNFKIEGRRVIATM